MKKSMLIAADYKLTLLKLRVDLLGIDPEVTDILLTLIPNSKITYKGLKSLDFNPQDLFILATYNKVVPIVNEANDCLLLEEVSEGECFYNYYTTRIRSLVHNKEVYEYLTNKYPQLKDSISLLRLRWDTKGNTLNPIKYITETYGITREAMRLKEAEYLRIMEEIPCNNPKSLEEKLAFIKRYNSIPLSVSSPV